jgi:hypothetical protein
MKIGGSNELLMVVGPVIAGVLIIIYMTDSTDVLRQAERVLLDTWTAAVAAFRR